MSSQKVLSFLLQSIGLIAGVMAAAYLIGVLGVAATDHAVAAGKLFKCLGSAVLSAIAASLAYVVVRLPER